MALRFSGRAMVMVVTRWSVCSLMFSVMFDPVDLNGGGNRLRFKARP
jgi:hypothetical protein